MAKETKSSIQLTDKFLIERENTEDGKVMKTIDGSDLQSFIEDSQSRFTDEIELAVTNLEATVDSNAITIGENAAENETAHTGFDNRITENEDNIAANQAEILTAKGRTDKLEADNRVFGYYSLQYFTEGTIDPEPVEGGFVLCKTEGSDLVSLRTGYSEVDTVRFNKTDLLSARRKFTQIYGSDIIELAFYTNAALDYKQATIESRVTFRVTLDFDMTTVDDTKEIIDLPVELVNGVGENISTTVSESPNLEIVIGFPFTIDVQQSPMPLDRYCKCGVYPSLNTEEQVTLSTMTDALAPIGTIVIWPSDDIPDGWLKCDGRNASAAKSGRNNDEKADIDKLFSNLGFSVLPAIAGRYVAGAKGSQYNNAVHNFNFGGIYHRQTGKPTNNNGTTKDLTVSSAGSHSHNASAGSVGNHTHKYGNTNRHASGNQANVYDARSEGGFETRSAGAHTHNVSVENSSNHTHNVGGFNNDTRPNTIAYHYIIKYRHVIVE